MSGTTTVRNAWHVCLAVAMGMLLRVSIVPTRPRLAHAQPPGPRVVALAPVEDETGSGRVAVLALTLNQRVRIGAGSLISLRGSQTRGRHG